MVITLFLILKTGTQNWTPYLFTYYLLKKLQETKGDVTLGELGDYIKTKVEQQSIVVNGKLQSPSMRV